MEHGASEEGQRRPLNADDFLSCFLPKLGHRQPYRDSDSVVEQVLQLFGAFFCSVESTGVWLNVFAFCSIVICSQRVLSFDFA